MALNSVHVHKSRIWKKTGPSNTVLEGDASQQVNNPKEELSTHQLLEQKTKQI